jgi:hypothetical protein
MPDKENGIHALLRDGEMTKEKKCKNDAHKVKSRFAPQTGPKGRDLNGFRGMDLKKVSQK